MAGVNSFKIFKVNNPNKKINRTINTYNLALVLMEGNLNLRDPL